MKPCRNPVLLVGAIAVLSACSDLALLTPDPAAEFCAAPSAAMLPGSPTELPLDSIFAAAGEEFGVPPALLKAIGYVETRWQMVEGHPEFPGQPAAYGLMALKGDQLTRAARLAGVSPETVRTDATANIRAAAALLRAYADAHGVRSLDLGGWAPAVADYSGIALPEGRSAYVHQDVYGVLRRGVAPHQPFGAGASLAPMQADPDFPSVPLAATAAAADYPAAVWRASPNFNGRPGDAIGRVAMVIIHTCEGSYTGCWSWLINPDSRVSAHYVVREDGSEVAQLVRESDRAWHIGSNYDCGLNQELECWRNGSSNNHFTVGIEHGGYASQLRWPAEQLDASARLVCDVARRHGIARDGVRIVGHAQLQPHNRTDPGRNWPWAEYLSRIRSHCADFASAELVIETDNDRNDRAHVYVTLSSNWIATRLTLGYFGSGYHFASSGAPSDPAIFHFYLPAPATRTVEAWWTAGSNRTPRALFTATDPQGRSLGTSRVDQQANGSRWNVLGTWHFPAGWNTVQLSREGPTGCVVIADAVRVR